jgi:flagellar hook protein FlgE
MYSGISGMKANQTKMDVIGNNVANVGTPGFKKSTTRFADTLYQTNALASGATAESGGTNPSQVGIGVKVNGIYKNMGQGSLQPTGRPSDLAIDGDGFLPVRRDGQILYTRDGSFSLDTNGNLVNGDGYVLLDSAGNEITIPKTDPNGKNVVAYNISKDGEIGISLSDGTRATLPNKIQIYTFQNPEGLEAIAGNMYTISANTGTMVNGNGSIIQGAVEMSNVDLSEEFTEMIVTTRAFQAAGKMITTSDELLQEIINLKR